MTNIDNFRFLNLTSNGNYNLSQLCIDAIKELKNMVVSLQNEIETLKKQ